jgi:cytochrome c oxidase assembly protein subunit 15
MYIKYMHEDNKNIYVANWLLLITLLLALMIAVGGITRLTDSGLSITKWDLFSGVVPPLGKEQWEIAFSLYKKIPEYILLNSSMNLNEFKFIFFWEYIHRLLGRVIGLCFILPLVFFTLKGFINKKSDIVYFYFIFLLICFQGFIGWYMVKSGLTERTDVSHYRLSLHLTFAFFIYILLFIKYLHYKIPILSVNGEKLPYKLPLFLVFLILVQISFGAFVSGLDAGQIYQTWPLMNENYFPDDSMFNELFTLKIFETPSLVQFLHRNIAYLIVLIFVLILFSIYSNNKYKFLRKSSLLVLAALLLQTFLGVVTVTSGAQIFIASMHQIGSIFLITTSVILMFINSKAN